MQMLVRRRATLVSLLNAEYVHEGDPYHNHKLYRTPLRQYVWASHFSMKIGESKPFTCAIITCIFLAGLLVGVQQYPISDESVFGQILQVIDRVILVAFFLEAFIKIHSEGAAPWRYFCGKERAWNNFDFLILLFSMPMVASALPGAGGEGNIKLLRLMRLARVAKLVRQVPQLQMIVMGLIGGIKSIGYIVLLLFLVHYFYAVIGVMLFRKNDPWHFRSLPFAMLTLFRCSTLEDWTDVMYINYFGCEEYSGGIYTIEEDGPNRPNADFWYCDEPEPVFAAIIFFGSFVVISALVMLSLFVGAVTMSMQESMLLMKKEAAEQERERKLQRSQQRQSGRRAQVTQQVHSKHKLGKVERQRFRLQHILARAIDGTRSDGEEMLQAPELPERGARRKYVQLANHCGLLVQRREFDAMITGTIVFAGLLVCLSTFESVSKDYGASLEVLDSMVLCIFIFEIIFKVIAEEFEPLNFFSSAWNRFDCVVVLGSLAGPLIGNDAESAITTLRLLRLLRVLRLVKSLPRLSVIVTALITGFKSISFIALILMMFYYMFAIVGMICFGDTDPWHFGSLHRALLSLFRASTLEDWTDIMYINMYGCDLYGYQDSLVSGVGTDCPHHELESSTFDAWSMFMVVLYFAMFILVGALVLLTLFIGVVTTAMEEATENANTAMEVDARAAELAVKQGWHERTMDLYRRVFAMLDIDNSHSIQEDELIIGLTSIGKETAIDFRRLWDSVDIDNSGEIDFAEFLQFMANLVAEDVELRSCSDVQSRDGRTSSDFSSEDFMQMQIQDLLPRGCSAEGVEMLNRQTSSAIFEGEEGEELGSSASRVPSIEAGPEIGPETIPEPRPGPRPEPRPEARAETPVGLTVDKEDCRGAAGRRPAGGGAVVLPALGGPSPGGEPPVDVPVG